MIISIVLLCGWIKTPRLAHGGASGEVFAEALIDEHGKITGISGRSTLIYDSTDWWDIDQWVGGLRNTRRCSGWRCARDNT